MSNETWSFFKTQSFFSRGGKNMLISQKTLCGVILRDVDDEEDFVNSISLKDILGRSTYQDLLDNWDRNNGWIDID